MRGQNTRFTHQRGLISSRVLYVVLEYNAPLRSASLTCVLPCSRGSNVVIVTSTTRQLFRWRRRYRRRHERFERRVRSFVASGQDERCKQCEQKQSIHSEYPTCAGRSLR